MSALAKKRKSVTPCSISEVSLPRLKKPVVVADLAVGRLIERPGKTLNYETPAERFSQSVASTG